MRAGIEITVTAEDRRRLEAIVRDRNSAQKHAARAKVILATADGCGTMEIARRSGLSKPAVWRWQERFMHGGVDGLLRDKTRPPGKPRLPDETVRRVLDLTLSEPPGEATHWTGRMMAKAPGVSLRSVQRIWDAHGLEPHRIRAFKLSRDPLLSERLKAVVGLYVDPPAHAVVLSVDAYFAHSAGRFGPFRHLWWFHLRRFERSWPWPKASGVPAPACGSGPGPPRRRTYFRILFCYSTVTDLARLRG
jgi:transposase